MKKHILLFALLLTVLNGFSKIVIIKNWGAHYMPADTTVNPGDTIKFDLVNTHNVVEVDQQTWEAEENAPLAGGFSLPMGGGILLTAQLKPGRHYYICTPHISLGMKGTFIIAGANAIADNSFETVLSIFPVPAVDLITVRTTAAKGSVYTITNNTGKQVLSGRLENNETAIPLTGIASGIYFFQTEGQRKRIIALKK